MSEKRCPHCGKWTTWTQNLEDTCQHCHKSLGGRYLVEQKERIRKDQEKKREWIFEINQKDHPVVSFMKKAANLFYFVFFMIVSFIVWLIAALPG